MIFPFCYARQSSCGGSLQEYLLRQTAHDKYIFSDGTAEIVAKIKIKARHFTGQPIDETTKVELIGEVDTSRKRPPKIEADAIRAIQ
ncbi:MAG: NirD/YgiW/YdeI family stress tolerance protein [Pigmentiphaga sp.]|nr:NirD/YgiW/YdeI family stress tolerance protein [Pigmentiphaga sp.]